MVLNTKPIQLLVLFFIFTLQSFSQNVVRKCRLSKSAQEVSIIRDNWGIAHVYGKTDADAVSGCFMSVKTILNVLK
jgi:acyl-homoserine lactone acylase PvdQ